MRNGVSFVFLFLLVVGVVALNTTCCKATTEQKDKDGLHLPMEEVEVEPGKEAKDKSASESWAEWVKEKLPEGLGGFRNSDDEGGINSDASNNNFDAAKKTKDKVTDTVTGKAKEKGCEASNEIHKKSDETKEKVAEKARDTKEAAMDAGKKAAEEGKKIEGEAVEKLNWAKEKSKEGYEAAKTKTGETYESAKDTFGSAKDDIINTGTGGSSGHNEEL